MKHLSIALVSIALATACANTENKTSDPMPDETTTTKDTSWHVLFDGKTMKGWHRYGGTTFDSAWVIDNGALRLSTDLKKKNGVKGDWDIITDGEYDNFELELDWKISKDGNSGIFIYNHEDKAKFEHTYETALEMQVIDNDGHPDGKIKKHRAGDLYDLIACSVETVKPVGEWNHVVIRALNGNISFTLNGTEVVKTTLWNDEWKTMVANSKFKSIPAFGTFKKGHIGLQDHGNDVWYRNIRVRKL